MRFPKQVLLSRLVPTKRIHATCSTQSQSAVALPQPEQCSLGKLGDSLQGNSKPLTRACSLNEYAQGQAWNRRRKSCSTYLVKGGAKDGKEEPGVDELDQLIPHQWVGHLWTVHATVFTWLLLRSVKPVLLLLYYTFTNVQVHEILKLWHFRSTDVKQGLYFVSTAA